VRARPYGEHLIALTRGGWCNCYLVREDDGLTLIDTTFLGGAGAIVAAAAAAGAPIARIALTHGHSDHRGSLDALAARLPDAEVSFGAREARYLRGDRSPDPGEPRRRPLGMAKVGTRPTRELVPGDRLGSLEVVAAPGHTPGQIAFLDVRDRTLIAGDAFSTLRGTYVTSKVNPRFPFPAAATWHRPTALESARRLRALEPARLAVGHGPVLEQPLAALDAAIAAAS